MSWTKKQIIDMAFNELGLSSYTYDMMPEQYTFALNKLDAMLALWTSIGIKIMYNLNAELNQDSGLPDWAYAAVYLNLSPELAPSYGKTPNGLTLKNAKMAYNMCLNKVISVPQMQYDYNTPAGAGNNRFFRNRTFLNEPTDNLEVSNSTDLT